MKNATLNWLRQQCTEHLLNEKWLVCDSLRTAQTWKDRINLAGTATINLHTKTLRSMALALIGEYLAESKLVYQGQPEVESLMQALIYAELGHGSLRYFVGLQRTEGLARLAARTIRDLRLAGIGPASLAAGRFEDPKKCGDLKLLYERYLKMMHDRALVDYADCLELARQRLNDGSQQLPTDLLVLQPHAIHWTLAEREFLTALAAKTEVRSVSLKVSKIETEFGKHNTAFFAGYGAVNEVRGVVQRVVGRDASSAIRLDDVEIAYTDDGYVPLIYELLEGITPVALLRPPPAVAGRGDNAPPVTFSEGIAAIYARPGRALRAWLRWIKSDGLQSKAVQMVREGILNRPEDPHSSTPIGYSRLASNLRRISIGFKLERYLPSIQATIAKAETLQQEFIKRRENAGAEENQPADTHDDEVPRDFGLPALKPLLAMFKPMVELAPSPGDSASALLMKAKRFIIRCARCESKLDRFARTKLLDEIDARLAALPYAAETPAAILAWLENLPVESAILGSGAQPGCIHATPIARAGHTGRKHLFVIGMDANSFPKSNRVDPLLLDTERQTISNELDTSTQLAERNAQQLPELLQRLAETVDVRLTFSYATRDLVEDRDQSPSAALADLFRQLQGLPEAHLDDLFFHIGDAVSFASRNSDHWLSEGDGRLVELLTTIDTAACQSKLAAEFPHFQSARIACEQRELAAFTEFDGLVPEAGPELSPTNSQSKVSSSRLETFGTCPRRFFFKYGLGVHPPDEWNIDPERWLDAITLGNLVHGLFERFMRELSSQDRVPNLDRDLPRLLEMLDEAVSNTLKDQPSPSEDALQRQIDWLNEACEIFLEREQQYCHDTGARPWVVEASIGLKDEPRSPLDCPEPVTLALQNGQVIWLGGRIDRVDRLNVQGSESYAIWDYKSGSDWGFNDEDPFGQGRKLQPFLYVGMLRHRLAATGKNKEAATSFGYFFPTAKTQGRRIEWAAAELKRGDEILQSICQLIAQGAFPATTNPSDCQYCDYNIVCPDANIVTVESIRMASEKSNDAVLGRWKELREVGQSRRD